MRVKSLSPQNHGLLAGQLRELGNVHASGRRGFLVGLEVFDGTSAKRNCAKSRALNSGPSA